MSEARILPELDAMAVPVDVLEPWPGNPRVGDIDALAESLRVNGQFRPLLVQKNTMRIMGGNHTWNAARKLGWDTIAVQLIECTDAEARRIVAADNAIGRLGSLNEYLLADLLSEVVRDGGLEGTGYQRSDLDAILDRTQTPIEDDGYPPSDPADLVPGFAPVDPSDQPRLDRTTNRTCPECGHTWYIGSNGAPVPVTAP